MLKNPEKEALTETKSKKPKKNTEILITTYFFVLLFLGMMGYLCHFVVTNEHEIFNNSYNSRQEILLSQNYRGSIFARDGELLATTRIDGDKEIREYPYSEMFSHIVGFSTHGRTGIEAQANYYLINSNAPLSDKVVNDMSGVKNPGDNVYTTLDVELQETAYKALGVYDGAIIVSEPSTGKILAMVSKPDFDPNSVDGMWDELTADTETGRLLNRATQGLYPPGSTFKIITALEYIRENKDTYSNYRYQCNGHFNLDEYSIECYHGANHGNIGFTTSFAKSCNSSFANIGTGLDRESFRDTLDDLLFDTKLPVEFNYTQSSVQMEENMTAEDIMQTSIGQGKTQITPLHLNLITCAIANDGILMKPYIIDSVKNNQEGTVKKFSPSSYKRLITENEAQILTDMMSAVVNEGTAKVLKGLEYTAAGKTGSAEYNSKGDSHAWFTGFAPADDPKVCVTIIIEGAGAGGDYAVPVAKRLFDAYFEQTPDFREGLQ